MLLIEAKRIVSAEDYTALHSKAIDAIKSAHLGGQITKILITGDPLLEKKDFKISRRRIAQRIRDGSIRLISPEDTKERAETSDETESIVIGHIADILKKEPKEIHPDDDFFNDLGGSSLEYFALIDRLREALGAEAPIETEQTLSTVREICQYIKTGKSI